MLIAEKRIRTMFDEKVAAIIRVPQPETALNLARALLQAGFKCVEVTMTVPGALDVIKTLAEAAPESSMIGAGTVTSAVDARACIKAGAQFIVSPICEIDIVRPCREAGVVAIPAGLSATEIMTAWRVGAHVVKVFPAGSVGGPAYIKAIRGPMPDIPLWVSGMLQPSETRAYLAAGAQIVGLNANALPQYLIDNGDWAGVADAARAMLKEALGEQRVPAGNIVANGAQKM
jgi:2-dehydro-3-deoxyphosphogluconate aldolase/(4S)-4-hydroxy-2-oxoglutarate aldolase